MIISDATEKLLIYLGLRSDIKDYVLDLDEEYVGHSGIHNILLELITEDFEAFEDGTLELSGMFKELYSI